MAEKKNLIDKVAVTSSEASLRSSTLSGDERTPIHSTVAHDTSMFEDEEDAAYSTRVVRSGRRHGRRSRVRE